MTLAAAQSWVKYAGDGATSAFAYSFAIDTTDGSDISVYVIDDANNVTQLTSNFSVDVANARVNYPTVGGVSPLAAGVNFLPAGWYIALMRVEPLAQTLALTDQGVFSPSAIEDAFDDLTMMVQQLQEQINRCYKAPVGSSVASSDLSAFLASISASFPPFSSDTYDNLKLLSAGAPTTKRWGFATDRNGGLGQLCFYTANTATGDAGWLLIPLEYLGGA